MVHQRWKFAWIVLSATTAVLVTGTTMGLLPMTLTEVLGFATGAACVMLVIRENLWNYPIGIANNVFFIILFWQARLFGDMTLQVIYILLAVHGWWLWVCGGKDRSHLRVTRASTNELVLLMGVGMALTAGGTAYFRRIHDSAPFLDALTTVFSLVAQWLLNRKRIENWLVWMSVDVIYVYLYVTKGLYLTAVLYAGFIGLCLAGLVAWRRTLSANRPVILPTDTQVADATR